MAQLSQFDEELYKVDTLIHTQTGRQTDRHRHRHTVAQLSQFDEELYKVDTLIHTQTDRQTNRQT